MLGHNPKRSLDFGFDLLLLTINIFQGCKFPPDAALEAFSNKVFNSSLETGSSRKDLIEVLEKTASVTFIILFYINVCGIPT